MSNSNIKQSALNALNTAANSLKKIPKIATDNAIKGAKTIGSITQNTLNRGSEFVKENVKRYEDYAEDFNVTELKKPTIYLLFIIILFILICCVIKLIYSNSINLSPEKSFVLTEKENITIFLIVLFTIGIGIVTLFTLPNYKDLLIFFSRLTNVYLLIVYIILLIILYRSVSRGLVDNYAYLFLPITLIIGIYLFYLAIKTDRFYGFNINYERVKYIIIYFCLLVFILLFYSVDPGDYLKTYFGPSLIISILLAIFGFLYLLTLMNLPGMSISTNENDDFTKNSFGGLFTGLTKMGLFSGITFLIFIIIVISGILAYPGGFMTNTTQPGNKRDRVAGIIILLIIIFVLWISFFGILTFTNKSHGNEEQANSNLSNVLNLARQIFMLLFGLVISGLLISWLVIGVQSLSTKSGVISFILNLIIIIAILSLVFKLITGGTFYRKYAIFRLIVNTLLYIPCILLGFIESLLYILGFGASVGKSGLSGLWSGLTTTIEATKNTPTTYYVLLIIIILIYIFYFFLGPQIQTNISKQGGVLLVNNPVSINTENVIGYYDQLNGTKTIEGTDNYDHNYKYAISFWLFIDSNSPNFSSSLNKYTSVLNYGNKPNILYNGAENTLIITLQNDGEPAIGSASRIKNPPELDPSGNIIVYKLSNVLLQKWNNIIINYTNGTLDIFYNGELVKSVNEAVPKMSKDALTIGSNKGIGGAICNLVYFNTHIDISQVYYLYNSVKNKNPPVSKKSKESIIKTVLNAAHIKNNVPVVTIPINIDVTAKVPKIEEKPVLAKPIKSDPNNIKMDYLSFDWYSQQ